MQPATAAATATKNNDRNNNVWRREHLLLNRCLERLGIPYGMINKEEDFELYDRYIIPGVGHAGAAMNKLEKTGWFLRSNH